MKTRVSSPLNSTFASSAPSSATRAIAAEFDISEEVALLVSAFGRTGRLQCYLWSNLTIHGSLFSAHDFLPSRLLRWTPVLGTFFRELVVALRTSLTSSKGN